MELDFDFPLADGERLDEDTRAEAPPSPPPPPSRGADGEPPQRNRALRPMSFTPSSNSSMAFSSVHSGAANLGSLAGSGVRSLQPAERAALDYLMDTESEPGLQADVSGVLAAIAESKRDRDAVTVFVLPGEPATLQASCDAGSATLHLFPGSVAEPTEISLFAKRRMDTQLDTVGPLVTLLPHGLQLLREATLTLHLPPEESPFNLAVVRNDGTIHGVTATGWRPCEPAAEVLFAPCALRVPLHGFCHFAAARGIMARLRLTIPNNVARAETVAFDVQILVDNVAHPSATPVPLSRADAEAAATEAGCTLKEFRCQLPVGTSRALSLVSRSPDLLPSETVSLEPAPVPQLESATQPLYETSISILPKWSAVPEEGAAVVLGVVLHEDEAHGAPRRGSPFATISVRLGGTTTPTRGSAQPPFTGLPPVLSHLPSSLFPAVDWDVMLSYRVCETGCRTKGGDNFTLDLRAALQEAGFTVFVCEHEIQVGDEWISFVDNATARCHAFVPICSTTYGDKSASYYCYQEMTYANDRRLKTEKPLILPVFHSGCYPPKGLGLLLHNVQHVPAGGRSVVELRAAGEADNTAATLISKFCAERVPRSAGKAEGYRWVYDPTQPDDPASSDSSRLPRTKDDCPRGRYRGVRMRPWGRYAPRCCAPRGKCVAHFAISTSQLRSRDLRPEPRRTPVARHLRHRRHDCTLLFLRPARELCCEACADAAVARHGRGGCTRVRCRCARHPRPRCAHQFRFRPHAAAAGAPSRRRRTCCLVPATLRACSASAGDRVSNATWPGLRGALAAVAGCRRGSFGLQHIRGTRSLLLPYLVAHGLNR